MRCSARSTGSNLFRPEALHFSRRIQVLTRVVEQITGDPAKFDGHQEQIQNYRNRLTNLKNKWRNNDCDDPNDPPYGTNLWLKDTSAGTLQEYQYKYQQYLEDLKVGAAAAAAGLLVDIGEFLGSLGGELAPVLVF